MIIYIKKIIINVLYSIRKHEVVLGDLAKTGGVTHLFFAFLFALIFLNWYNRWGTS